jgi:hypothetical protein
MTSRISLLSALVACLLSTGCVRRTLTVKSDPPGALVFLNGTEVGRTPLKRDFTWYGTYDVELRKEGYETLKAHGRVIAPWWQWVPIDLAAELLPLHDRRTLAYTMRPYTEARIDPQQMLARAQQMSTRLRSSRYTRQPSTKPAVTATTRPTRRPARALTAAAPITTSIVAGSRAAVKFATVEGRVSRLKRKRQWRRRAQRLQLGTSR